MLSFGDVRFTLLLVYVLWCTRMYESRARGAQGWDPLQRELQIVVLLQMWVLGTER